MKAHGLILMILPVLVTGAASQARADVICSDATGDLKYEQTGYNRGMAPRPGDRMSYEKWSFKGVMLGEFSQFFMAQSQPAQMPLLVTTSERQTLKTEPYLCGGSFYCGETVHFSMKIEIRKPTQAPDPSPSPDPGADYSAYVVCRSIQINYP